MLRLAYDVLNNVIKNGAYAELALKNALCGEDRETARSVTRLVYTTLENLSYLDYIIDAYKKGRLHGSVRNILRLSLARLIFDGVPDYATVNGGAELARNIGKGELAGYVNGVLRRIARDLANGRCVELPKDTVKSLSIRCNMPAFMVEEYLNEYGEEFTRAMLTARIRDLCVRAQYPYTSEELEKELLKEGIPTVRGEYDENALRLVGGANIAETDAFLSGRMTVQSEGAMLACRALRLTDGMRVLDTCAAPGGKTAYISSLMHATGSITAFEVHPHRTELIRQTLARLNVKNCRIETRDASLPYDEGKFDAVLCDVPCSGLGGAKPDASISKTDADIIELSGIQQRILLCAADSVRPGGALVYSTCTVSKRENADNIRAFLEKRGDFELDDISGLVKGRVVGEGPGIGIFPNVHGMDGFYIARLIRKKNR